MTTFHYSPLRSEIVNFLMAPIFAYYDKDKVEWDLPSNAREILGSAYDDLFAFAKELEDIKEKVKEVYLVDRGHTVAYYAYEFIRQKGHEPQSIEEAISEIAKLSADEMKTVLEACLGYRRRKNKEQTLIDYLEEQLLEAEERWYWLRAFQKPDLTLQHLVEVLTEVTKRYRPYYDKYAAETLNYAESLDIRETLSTLAVVDIESFVSEAKNSIEVYILTPNHLRLSFMDYHEDDLSFSSIFFSMNVDKLIHSSSTVDIANLAVVLKQLGDETRYKVLLAIIDGKLKNKEIAEDLGITAAAVSFHTQKLLNTQLLVVNKEGQKVKYLPNKELLTGIIDRLKNDFQLDL